MTRMHMPGHKGKGTLGIEKLDITEITGADVLYSADGIISESQRNAAKLFGTAATFYSTEGSTLAIKAMLALVHTENRKNRKTLILAQRNAHKAFINAAALLDLEVEWMYHDAVSEHICSCVISADSVKKRLSLLSELPDAVYITSPDYLGNIADVAGISSVCDSFGIPLLVDNAHGAYLNFLDTSAHPIALGASMCCDSAHKTLPVITGGAYLHVAKKASRYVDRAASIMSLFASTSPSYLIMQSLDLCNDILDSSYRTDLMRTVDRLNTLKSRIFEFGFEFSKSEALKLVINAKRFGYTGADLAEHLQEYMIEPEFVDEDYVVLMASTSTTERDFVRIETAFGTLKTKKPILQTNNYNITPHKRGLSIRDAVFSPTQKLPVHEAVGRICAAPTVSCPPAIPIVVSGEIIEEGDVELFFKYGKTDISVVSE